MLYYIVYKNIKKVYINIYKERKNMNIVERNIILYYADYLSLVDISSPVTDNCKYYFIYDFPLNATYLVDSQPFFDVNNKYYTQAFEEYNQIKDKFGDDGIQQFLAKICNVQALGCINAEQMLKCIHQFSTRKERKIAFSDYCKWKASKIYTHIEFNDDGEPIRKECTEYVAHQDESGEVHYIQGGVSKP